MGAGKTTVAEALSHRLNCMMIDLDQFITEQENSSPQEIIDNQGEVKFREIETRSLQKAVQTDTGIIALGGGAWAIEENRMIAKAYGHSVWLDAAFELCWERISTTGEMRPFARDFDKALERYAYRRQFYKMADLRIEIMKEKTPELIAIEIIDELNRIRGIKR
jgi:shikimate kinase